MVIDVITYNGEKELFDIRYNVLKDYVDEFRVVEFDQTFSGKTRTPDYHYFDTYTKAKHYLVKEDTWSKYHDLAIASPNTEYGKGADHWVREFCQKESIKDCLTDLGDDDIVFISDCDEVWSPHLANGTKDFSVDKLNDYWVFKESKAYKIKMLVYSYYLNNRSNEEFYGTIQAPYLCVRNACLNELRSTNNIRIELPEHPSWHFTSMGGHEKVKQKLTDSYTEQTYAPPAVLENLEDNIKNNRDFLGRDFTYTLDESNWPEYLKKNKDKYKHLCL